ncbi:MAG: aminotransferase class IV family protein [Microthrixaceae bacterium]|nr:aminotransferase class IV family protein [Microthrixaceae bacterium]
MSRVWINGEMIDEADARVAYDDHGITVGDGAFETAKVIGGRPFALRRHLDRLGGSLAALRLGPLDLATVRDAVEAVCADHGGDGFVRVTVTAGRGPLGSPRGDISPTVIVAIRPGSIRTEPCDVIVVGYTRNENGALAGVKSTSYAENVLALADALAVGSEEALFANTAGMLCEGTGSNVFVGLDGELLTPPLSAGCLAGVTRALVLEQLDVALREADIPMDALGRCDEMFLVSTGREVQPVRSIDGVALPGCPGHWTNMVRSAWVAAFSGPDAPIDP